MDLPEPSLAAVAALAPTGVLRAAINTSNFLLVANKGDNGPTVGVSPDMASALGACLGVEVELLDYDTPASVADDATSGNWDIGNIGAEPKRAEFINFTAAYAEIEATYAVRGDSPVVTIDQVDRPGRTVICKSRSAYGLWLERNLAHATLTQVDTHDEAWSTWTGSDIEVLAALRPWLADRTPEHSSSVRVLEGRFTSVQQAMGTPRSRPEAGIDFLRRFVEAAKMTGLVARSIEDHGVGGRLSVAPAAGGDQA